MFSGLSCIDRCHFSRPQVDPAALSFATFFCPGQRRMTLLLLIGLPGQTHPGIQGFMTGSHVRVRVEINR